MSARTDLRVGLLAAELAEWGGGWDLLRLIAAGLAGTECRVTLLIPRATPLTRVRKRLGIYWRAAASIARWERPTFRSAAGIDFPRMIQTVRGSDCEFEVVEYPSSGDGLARAVNDNCVDVLLPCMCSPGAGCRGIGYIPDLQHKYLPQYFSCAEIAQRDRRFQRLLQESSVLIVTSRNVKADLEKYYEVGNCQIVVLPFTPLPQREWLGEHSEAVRAKYSLPARYFLISNQFWQHKDHATAFEAFALLAARDVQLICTGSTHDYRAPEYFASLERLIEKLGVKDRVRFLGHIPKREQIAIMRSAVAVVQPTLFEGGPGGGSVYDAVGIGTHAIVSDIPVNREIADEEVEFFRVGSPLHLAEKMQQALEAPRVPLEAELLLQLARLRRERLGQALMHAIDVAMQPQCAVTAR